MDESYFPEEDGYNYDEGYYWLVGWCCFYCNPYSTWLPAGELEIVEVFGCLVVIYFEMAWIGGFFHAFLIIGNIHEPITGNC